MAVIASTLQALAALDAAIRATCPIDGVSGDGTIWFSPGATPAQQTAARAALTAFVAPAVVGPPPLVTLMAPLPQPKSVLAA